MDRPQHRPRDVPRNSVRSAGNIIRDQQRSLLRVHSNARNGLCSRHQILDAQNLVAGATTPSSRQRLRVECLPNQRFCTSKLLELRAANNKCYSPRCSYTTVFSKSGHCTCLFSSDAGTKKKRQLIGAHSDKKLLQPNSHSCLQVPGA